MLWTIYAHVNSYNPLKYWVKDERKILNKYVFHRLKSFPNKLLIIVTLYAIDYKYTLLIINGCAEHAYLFLLL